MGLSLPDSRRMDWTVVFERGRKRLHFSCPETTREANVYSSTSETRQGTAVFGML